MMTEAFEYRVPLHNNEQKLEHRNTNRVHDIEKEKRSHNMTL